MSKTILLCLIILVLAACDTTPTPTAPPTDLPFPTVTPGQVVRAPLPPPNVIPLDGGGLNPATQVALAARPTATPNRRACPAPSDSVTLSDSVPASGRAMETAIAQFLSAGGTAIGLQRDLVDKWNALGGTGFVRGDIDMTGEGTAEIVVSLNTPDEGGALMVFGCVDGRVDALYRQGIGGSAPAILQLSDMNADGRTDLLYSSQTCVSGICRVHTQLAGSVDGVRVVNLLSAVIDSAAPVRVEDVDQDRIQEIVVQFGEQGTPDTGPQRTGFSIYDWDGYTYTEALTQLDPARYLIQVVFDGDQAFKNGQYEQAAALYNSALTSTSLESWQPDDRTVLPPYLLYRMLLAYTQMNDSRRSDVQQAILVQYPDPANQPVYATMALTFWNAYQITNNLNSACLEVLSIMAAHPEALTLLNRYGSSSPTYTPQDVCPF